MKNTLLFVLGLFALAACSHALTLTQTGAEIQVEYIEPSTNSDGSPLEDLSYTTIFYTLESVISTMTVTATSPNGGGNITRTITVPIGPNQEGVVTAYATATDDNGNESEHSNEASIEIDRLAPAPPQ